MKKRTWGDIDKFAYLLMIVLTMMIVSMFYVNTSVKMKESKILMGLLLGDWIFIGLMFINPIFLILPRGFLFPFGVEACASIGDFEVVSIAFCQ